MTEMGNEREKEFREVLLYLAKKAIQNKLEMGDFREIEPHEIHEIEVPPQVQERLREKKGVFVTIRRRGELRGCIGTLAEDELWRQVQRYAVFSAFNDPRFEPLGYDELDEMTLEISIIEDVKEIKDVSEIKLGEHGIIADMRGKGGILLPEVAAEHGVRTPQEFLDMLCRKIGVPPGSWKDAKIRVFRTRKYS